MNLDNLIIQMIMAFFIVTILKREQKLIFVSKIKYAFFSKLSKANIKAKLMKMKR
jgi:hypothetical protein